MSYCHQHSRSTTKYDHLQYAGKWLQGIYASCVYHLYSKHTSIITYTVPDPEEEPEDQGLLT